MAIDRNAGMIDSAKIEGASYDDSDYVALHITGEVAVEHTGGRWAVLAGLAGGSLSLDGGGDLDILTVDLGVKHYISPVTSLTLLGSYTWHDGNADFEVGTATVSVKQRLQPATAPISPFVRLSTAVQFVDQLESYDVLVLAATAGCDFMMSRDMAVVFEGGISESEEFDDGIDRADGWIMNVALRYYWE